MRVWTIREPLVALTFIRRTRPRRSPAASTTLPRAWSCRLVQTSAAAKSAAPASRAISRGDTLRLSALERLSQSARPGDQFCDRALASRSTSVSTSSLFSRTPSAPASLTASSSFGASSAVSAIRHSDGCWFRRWATAVTPSTSGMWTSITTASGSRTSACSIASRPFSATPTTPNSGCRSISSRKASRNSGSSPASRTRISWRSATAISSKGNFRFVPMQTDARPVALIGASLDLGAGRRGVDMGPSAIRYAGLDARIERLGRDVYDWGNVEGAVPEATEMGSERVRFLAPIKQACERVAHLVARAVDEGLQPLVLGGDHSVAIGTLGGLARANGVGGVLWLDAHGDLNRPETSPTGNVHGMPLAAALGLAGPEFESEAWTFPAVTPERVALVGVRSLDPAEASLLSELEVEVYTMSDVDKLGLERVIRQSLAHIAGSGFVHVSLDMDALEPDIAPGVGTPVRGGLSYREAHLAMELVAESGLAGSLEVVEVNPILDSENETAKLAVELVASALGARIF